MDEEAKHCLAGVIATLHMLVPGHPEKEAVSSAFEALGL